MQQLAVVVRLLLHVRVIAAYAKKYNTFFIKLLLQREAGPRNKKCSASFPALHFV
jgi:hypothetical protein